MEKLVEVKSRIKTWEHQFKDKYNRLPGKDDIKRDKVIRQLYSDYKSLKSQPSDQVSKNNKVKGSSKTEVKIVEVQDDAGELGPTPQANGKVLSIFDVRLTPPESSPLKGKQVIYHSDNDTFKTPTKRRNKLEPINNNVNPSQSLTAKLQALSEESIPETPVKIINNDISLMTPQYMAPGAKTTFVSPTKLKFTTPRKNLQPITFQVSPSPIKPMRFMMKISDMAKEVNSYKNDIVNEGFSDDESGSEVEEEDKPTQSTFKKKNPKRTTRRWKMKPKDASDNVDGFKPEDVHKKIDELKDKEKAELSVYLDQNVNSEAESGSDSDSDGDFKVGSNNASTKGKVKPISNNYKRLKINKANKKFKRRRR